MAQAKIQGGAYLGVNGKWHDANGKPLTDEAIEELKKLGAIKKADKADKVEKADKPEKTGDQTPKEK